MYQTNIFIFWGNYFKLFFSHLCYINTDILEKHSLNLKIKRRNPQILLVACLKQSLKSDFSIKVKKFLLKEYSKMKIKLSDHLNLVSTGHCTTIFLSYIIVSFIFQIKEVRFRKEVSLQVAEM